MPYVFDYSQLSPETKLRRKQALKRWSLTPKGVLTYAYQHQKGACKQRNHPLPSYTLQELHNRYLQDPVFIRLYEQWEKSGYKKHLKPSLDRIDPTKSYTFENIQLMTWEENFRKSKREFQYTEVLMCDMDGNELRRFKSMQDAANALGASPGNISACCSGKRNHTKGYRWRYGDSRHYLNPERYPSTPPPMRTRYVRSPILSAKRRKPEKDTTHA